MATNTVLYHQPLVLTEGQVRVLLNLRICRASVMMEDGHVVHCLEREGHDHMHRAGVSWAPCPAAIMEWRRRYRCIRPEHHKGDHDFGGWGQGFRGWSALSEPGPSDAQPQHATAPLGPDRDA